LESGCWRWCPFALMLQPKWWKTLISELHCRSLEHLELAYRSISPRVVPECWECFDKPARAPISIILNYHKLQKGIKQSANRGRREQIISTDIEKSPPEARRWIVGKVSSQNICSFLFSACLTKCPLFSDCWPQTLPVSSPTSQRTHWVLRSPLLRSPSALEGTWAPPQSSWLLHDPVERVN
jgi:hypothetical protein